jgi:hypothetical protein
MSLSYKEVKGVLEALEGMSGKYLSSSSSVETGTAIEAVRELLDTKTDTEPAVDTPTVVVDSPINTDEDSPFSSL